MRHRRPEGEVVRAVCGVTMMVEEHRMFTHLDLEVRADARAVLEVEAERRGASLKPESSTSTSWVAT
eukprot:12970727-Heterocapsa_arctica.AAC.1